MKHLHEYTQQAQTNLFRDTGSFFAFNDEQLENNRAEGVIYVNMGAGLICPKENTDKLLNGLEKIQQDAIEQDVKENGAAAIIAREYWNYETQITMDNTNARAAIEGHVKRFPEVFTDKLIKETFAECFEKAIEQDLF